MAQIIAIFSMRSDSCLIFKENYVLIEEDNPSEKNCYSRGIAAWYIEKTLQAWGIC